MPAVASLEDLLAVQEHLNALKTRFPEAYLELSGLFKTHRKVGYKNICKLMLGEATPEKLKGMSGE